MRVWRRTLRFDDENCVFDYEIMLLMLKIAFSIKGVIFSMNRAFLQHQKGDVQPQSRHSHQKETVIFSIKDLFFSLKDAMFGLKDVNFSIRNGILSLRTVIFSMTSLEAEALLRGFLSGGAKFSQRLSF